MDAMPTQFFDYDDRFQPSMLIEGYKETWLRVPKQRFRRPLTLTEVTGPLNLARKLAMGNNDLSRAEGQVHSESDSELELRSAQRESNDAQHAPSVAPRAQGQLITVSGRLLDEDARPLRDAVVELWHANASGRYRHRADEASLAPLDPHFIGSGRTLTDQDGHYRFTTIKPGAYPVPNHPTRWWRPPHIHFSVFGESFMSRLVTQMFFPGEPLNEIDLILNAVPDTRGRARMIAKLVPMLDTSTPGAIGFEHDLVVRGSRQTPFEAST